MEAVHTVVILIGLAITIGTILWSNGRIEGKRQVREDDLYRRMQIAEQWQIDKGATRNEIDAVQASFHDALSSLLKSVDSRMKSVEDNVGKVETQVSELRKYLLQRNHLA